MIKMILLSSVFVLGTSVAIADEKEGVSVDNNYCRPVTVEMKQDLRNNWEPKTFVISDNNPLEIVAIYIKQAPSEDGAGKELVISYQFSDKFYTNVTKTCVVASGSITKEQGETIFDMVKKFTEEGEKN